MSETEAQEKEVQGFIKAEYCEINMTYLHSVCNESFNLKTLFSNKYLKRNRW